MESVTFNSLEAQRNVFQGNNVVPLIKVKAANFTDDLPPVIASGGSNKFLCFTNKKPSEVRILDRIKAQKADVTVPFNVSQIIATGEVAFAVAGESSVALLTAELHADASLTASEKIVTLESEIKGIAASSNGGVVVTTSAGQVVQLSAEGNIIATFELPNVKPPVKSCVAALHKELAVAVVPGRSANALDVISLNSRKSLLSKPWIPHGDEAPTAAYVFQSRSFSASPAGSRWILTAACNNTELRFWVLAEDNSFTLVQQLTIATEEAAATGASARLLSLSSSEEYILLASVSTSSIIAIELDRTQFKAARVTDWNPNAPTLFIAPIVRKTMQDGKSMSIDLGAVVRSSEQVSMVSFDAGRLVGASNLSSGAVQPRTSSPSSNIAASPVAASGMGQRQGSSSVTKWFGVAEGGAAAIAPPTTVSSSISGKVSSSADAQHVTNQAVSAIKGQSATFRESLSAVDAQIVALQRQAGVAMKVLQEAKAKDEAQLAGREFAMRNKHRIAGQPGAASPAGAAAGVMSQQQLELMQGVKALMDTIPSSVRTASNDTTRRLLQNAVPTAIARAMAAADAVEQEAALPKLSISEGMQQFDLAVDKVHQSQNNLLKTERNTVEALSVRMLQGGDRIAKTLQASKTFMAALKSEVQGLKTDVAEARDAIRTAASSGGIAAAAPQTAEQLLEEAASLAAAGKWSDAITRLDKAPDVAVLMHFLQSDYVRDNAHTLVAVNTIPLPLMVQVCLKLSTDLRAQLGNAPFRLKWVHDFLVEWDDVLQEMKESNSASLNVVKSALEQIAFNLDQVDPRKEVDRSTKNQLTLSRKLVQALL